MDLAKLAHVDPPIRSFASGRKDQVAERLREAAAIVDALPEGTRIDWANLEVIAIDTRCFNQIFAGCDCLETKDNRYLYVGLIRIECVLPRAHGEKPPQPKVVSLPPADLEVVG